jgi:ABC-type transport system involved in multi-copper enzyme maturation permease subunit
MKYLAILKDSLREALDSKVLYVLLALALLMMLFTATLSFRPLSAAQTFEQVIDGTAAGFLEAHKPPSKERKRPGKGKGRDFDFGNPGFYRLEKHVVVRGDADSPDADYLLTLSKMYINDESAAKVREQPDAELDAVRKHFERLERHGFFHIGAVRVAAEQPTRPFNVHFEVEWQATSGTRRLWLHELSVLFGSAPLSDFAVPLGFQLFLIAQLILQMGSWIAVLLGVIITSFFIPNMLQKGTVDLLLVKPIRRSLLLLFKFVGGLTFILLIHAFAILGVWFVLGLRSGLWANWMLLLIPILTFFFAILYSVSTLMAVLTRSTVTAILVTIGAWFMFFIVGQVQQFMEMQAYQEESTNVPVEKRKFAGSTLQSAIETAHRVLPRTSDLNQLTSLLLFSDFMTGGYLAPEEVLTAERNWWESFGVSAAFIALMLGLGCWRFTVKDY